MHTILYDNAPSDWNEGLPIGNGVFGGMCWFRNAQYHTALNHYEVYYSICERYRQKQQVQERIEETKEPPCAKYVKAAQENFRDYTKGPYRNYRKSIWPKADEVKDTPMHRGVSHPTAGEVFLTLSDKLCNPEQYRLSLDIEDAKVRLFTQREQKKLEIETCVLTSNDTLVHTVKQSEPGCVGEMSLIWPKRRNQQNFTCSFQQVDDRTFLCRASFFPWAEDRSIFPPFCFVTAIRLSDAKGELVYVGEREIRLKVKEDKKEYQIFACTVTQLQSSDPVTEVIRQLNVVESGFSDFLQKHGIYWNNFFEKSSVCLPDKFLEKLWYHSLYILNCCSGKNGRRFEQACGLNGLWDVRQPTIWGSQWYWDVNIQAAFWPVYTANHLELAEVFNEGFLAYAEDAARRAREFYHAPGYAIDYPFEFYNCIWPWCAQFLWWYYEYTQDKKFLREKAYPMFREQVRFISHVAKYDEERCVLVIFPDVSPEQGPVARNSTVTLSVVKYLLYFTMKANRILNESEEEFEEFEKLYHRLPDYPTAHVFPYGEMWRDSEVSPPGIPLRHPSLLMPVFPVGEVNRYSREHERILAENSVRFASENTEIGVFQFGWISAAASRLGWGNLALRVLYEQGLDLILRANGMGAEETDRWINHCLVEGGPLYFPCMMECVGEIPLSINEMLLQSVDNEIRVFPAIPDGREDIFHNAYCQEPLAEPSRKEPPPIWQDVSFEKLLAKGGFEVSAELTSGKVSYVNMKSLYGLPVRLRLPKKLCHPKVMSDGKDIPFQEENGVLCFETQQGCSYRVLDNCQMLTVDRKIQRYHEEFHYLSHLGRRVFAGKDANTDTIRLLDSFLHDHYIANERYHSIIPYCFSFGVDKACMKEIKVPRYLPAIDSEKQFIKITPLIRYTEELGFGFSSENHMCSCDTGEFNCLLQDFIQGDFPMQFWVELPKGMYEFLVVSGGSVAETIISIKNGNGVRMQSDAERYAAETLFVHHKEDGPLYLDVQSKAGKQWNLNLLVIRKQYAQM